jgi:TRAP-type C4-dicarboxylate transport system permease small subunit
MNIVRLIDRGLSALVTACLVCSFVLMIGIAAAQVLLRQLMHTSIPWGDIAARNLVIWVGFFGAYLATRGDRHFRIEFFARFLGQRPRLILGAVSDFFAALICGFLVTAGWTFIAVGLDAKAVLFLGIHQSTAALIVPVGFLLMTVQFALKALQNIVKATRKEPDKGPD